MLKKDNQILEKSTDSHVKQKPKTVATNLILYGISHALVDAVSIGILFSAAGLQTFSENIIGYLFIMYNISAFGLQVFLGFAIDVIKAPRAGAALGIIITGIAAVILVPLPIAAIILAGIGNALFHVGGGVISLNLTPRKATAPGIFVAPGALGVLAGTLLGRSGQFIAWPFLVAMAAALVIIFLVPKPAMYQKQQKFGANQEFKFEYVLYLILFVIAIRSLVGWAVVFPWKSDINLLVMLTIAVVMGKGLGGFIADRLGWTRVAVGSLLISIPLFTLGINTPLLGMAGMLLFNITMPVTLALTANMIPGKPGTAFGMTCAALLLGTLPAFTGINTGTTNLMFVNSTIAISALALYIGLRFYFKGQSNSGPNTREIPTTGLKNVIEETERK